jgi:hypothetical protein
MVTNHGYNFIVYENPKMNAKSTRYDRHDLAKEQVITAYIDWTYGMRQAHRIAKDLTQLNTLPEGKYSITGRQRTGHRYYGKLQCGDEVFMSSAIQW